MGHLFHATSSFVYHFIAIGEFKLESQSEMPNLGQKLKIDNFFSRVTSQFDRWPKQKGTSSMLLQALSIIP